MEIPNNPSWNHQNSEREARPWKAKYFVTMQVLNASVKLIILAGRSSIPAVPIMPTTTGCGVDDGPKVPGGIASILDRRMAHKITFTLAPGIRTRVGTRGVDESPKEDQP